MVIGPNAWVGGKYRCVVYVDLQAVAVLEFYSFGSPFLRGFGQALEKGMAYMALSSLWELRPLIVWSIVEHPPDSEVTYELAFQKWNP